MNKAKEFLASKNTAQYVTYAILFAGIIADILFLILDGSDQTFTLGCFLFVLAGSLAGLADAFFGWNHVCLLLSSFLYTAGTGFHLIAALPSISDLWNGVNFIGGNQELAIAFGIIFLLIDIYLIVINFFGLKKK